MFSAGRPLNTERAGPNTRCQVRHYSLLGRPHNWKLTPKKCLKYGHFTYQCKNARPYVPRPSRTAQLAEGGGPKERKGTEVPDEFLTSGKGVADRILKAKEEARKRLEAEEEKEKRKAAKANKGKGKEVGKVVAGAKERRRARSYVVSIQTADRLHVG